MFAIVPLAIRGCCWNACRTYSATMGRINEIKHLLSGEQKQFTDLERWRLEEGKLAVARWIAPEDNPFQLPPGTTSWGVWTMSIPHITAYRIHKPNGEISKYRFDVIEKLSICDHAVSFHDLLLDAWVDGKTKTLTLEDECEVKSAMESSLLTTEQIRIINTTKHYLTNETNTLLRSVDSLIDTAVQLHKNKES
uniref:DUF402 domain-containing protein n=1 Tax=Vannella robusta TaxID=1487602 RepID=A0A7S4MA60_9EUKA|mmetsp:Transcript_15867/g.20196  ORF Transcript_15867/g.20196 Transcript_15867/m.20196 type:complete len:194 (+) Transcript_15867:49-630(+)